VKFTVYPGVGHDSWTESYNNPALYEWFLSYPLADQGPMQAKSFATEIKKPASLNYLLYLPPDYGSDVEWPLILFLHGRGERGSDLELVAKHGLPARLAAGDDFPFIIVSPQCPADSYWPEEVDALNALLDQIIAHYNVDTRRLYLTGLSMGGRGTWHLAARYPERFAAIAPICGAGNNWMARERLASMPTWIFHGDADPVVSVTESQRMDQLLREAGNTQVRLTIYPGVDHNSWTPAYNDPELYTWLLSHQTAAPQPDQEEVAGD
jgi:predicted peptidase